MTSLTNVNYESTPQRLVNISGASTDAILIELWLTSQSSPHTRRAYSHDVGLLTGFLLKPLSFATLTDIQAFLGLLDGSEATKNRTLSAVKSLFAFGHRCGYLAFDVCAAIKLPRMRNKLAQRILTEEQVVKLIEAADPGRDRLILRTLYLCGLRVSELCGLNISDLAINGDSGQMSIYGKGCKTRNVVIPRALWLELLEHIDGLSASSALFRSVRTGGHLDASAIHRIVQECASRAGLAISVSPHWLRHAHASHALDRGAPAHLVQQTLGHSSLAVTSAYAHARPSESSGGYLKA